MEKAAAEKAAAEEAAAEKAGAAHLTGMYAEAMLAINEAARTMAALANDVLYQPDDRASSATSQDLQANPTSAEPNPLGLRVVGFRPPTHDDLAFAVDADFARTRHELESLIRIPSVSASDFDAAELEYSAQAVAGLLRSSGVSQVRLLEIGGAHPAVYGEIEGPQGAPTVLLYAHHDVQPPGPAEEWESSPFEPVERDGRLYGRGVADNKAGVVLHAAAIRAFDGAVPVNVKLFIEGEEAVGSTHLGAFIDRYGDLLAADVVVIADSANWKPGVPSITTSLRGLVDCIVEVTTLDTAVGSGQYGGTVPDAITVLARMIASLHDHDGGVAVAGLVSEDADDLGLAEQEFRSQIGVVEGIELMGSDSLTSRMWRRPSISVLAIDAPAISHAVNQIVPTARAKVSMRIAPGQDPERAMAALVAHLESAVPWGTQVTITPGASEKAFEFDTNGPATQMFAEALSVAYGGDVVEVGVGGSIPIVSAFQHAHPAARIIINGVADSTSNAHAPNESVSLQDFRSGVLAEAIALRLLAEEASKQRPASSTDAATLGRSVERIDGPRSQRPPLQHEPPGG